MLILPFESSHFLQNFDRFTVKMHFRILKMNATSGFLAALNCTEFVFGRGSAPDPAGRAYSAFPDPLAGLRDTTSKRGKRRKGRRGGSERRGSVNEPSRFSERSDASGRAVGNAVFLLAF